MRRIPEPGRSAASHAARFTPYAPHEAPLALHRAVRRPRGGGCGFAHPGHGRDAAAGRRGPCHGADRAGNRSRRAGHAGRRAREPRRVLPEVGRRARLPDHPDPTRRDRLERHGRAAVRGRPDGKPRPEARGHRGAPIRTRRLAPILGNGAGEPLLLRAAPSRRERAAPLGRGGPRPGARERLSLVGARRRGPGLPPPLRHRHGRFAPVLRADRAPDRGGVGDCRRAPA